jgi:biopolymer transport protein ExbB/TolQ
MNPWVIGIVGLLIGMFPSVYFCTQLSSLRKKLQLAENGKERSEKAYSEAQDELEAKNQEIDTANNKITELENQHSREIENLEQSHQADIEKLQQTQAKSLELEDLTNQVQ